MNTSEDASSERNAWEIKLLTSIWLRLRNQIDPSARSPEARQAESHALPIGGAIGYATTNGNASNERGAQEAKLLRLNLDVAAPGKPN